MSHTKKLIIVSSFILVIVIITLSIVFSNGNKESQSVSLKRSQIDLSKGLDTPNRVRTGEFSATFPEAYTFSEAINDSDFVAHVIITGWLEENNALPYPRTIFSAEILESYSGDVHPKSITVMQYGGEDFTFDEYPLFQKGDELLLCLTKDNVYDVDAYQIVGNFSTVLYLSESDGEIYAAKRFSDFSDTTALHRYNEDVLDELFQREKDISDDVGVVSCVYSLEELGEYINEEVR